MPSATCRTCIFWLTDDQMEERRGYQYSVVKLDVLDPTTYEPIDPQPFGVRYCASPKVRDNERPERDGATVADGSDFYAVLITGEDFGCMHHRLQ